MRRAVLAMALAAIGGTAFAQSASVAIAPDHAAPARIPDPPAVVPPAAPMAAGASSATGPATLLLRGLDKITGRPTSITAPIGKPVSFATLTITARYCYSTPPSETPETAAFVQIEDRRADQPSRRIFSGWMYASSPGLNGVEHPLYDVWVITCRNGALPAVAIATAPVKVASPDSSDKEQLQALPEGAGQ